MIRIERFRAEHLLALDVHGQQPELDQVPGERVALAHGYEAAGRCFTVLRDGAVPIMCAGILETHDDYATMWSALARDAGPAMLAITRRVRWFMATLPHARVDAVVRGRHSAAHRWMAMLGFAAEARLAAYFTDGDDAVIYRRVR